MSSVNGSHANLFNGNIAAMATAIRKTDESVLDILINGYQYDQLQRIRSVDAYFKEDVRETNYFSGASLYRETGGEGAYAERYDFDRNGNLKHLRRNGSGIHFTGGGSTALLMDDFTYHYYETLTDATAGVTESRSHQQAGKGGRS